jgi:hypothetical protein
MWLGRYFDSKYALCRPLPNLHNCANRVGSVSAGFYLHGNRSTPPSFYATDEKRQLIGRPPLSGAIHTLFGYQKLPTDPANVRLLAHMVLLFLVQNSYSISK